MISLKSALAYVLLLAASAGVSAFDASKCDVYVFRTEENALWHCGAKLPGESWNHWTSLYCDHSLQEPNAWPFAWASNHPDDWCDFMVSTVRAADEEDAYPLTPAIDINDTPGPNVWTFSAIKDWGCYMVENGVTTESYIVKSQEGEHASTVNEMCPRSINYFDYWNLHSAIRNLVWYGHLPEESYMPHRSAWGRCHYDAAIKGPNYVPELGVEYAECNSGFYCELKYQDYAACLPDPHVDHECCISWNNKCENEGDCCKGSECNAGGYCEVGIPEKFEDPPGICESRALKEEKKLFSRCYDYGNGQGDCADGYVCIGSSWHASCYIDETVKNDCCKWKWDNSNPRPGDCCVGWMSYCHRYANDSGKCLESQCVPGRETGSDEFDNSMLDVHDRLCTEVPPQATFNEQIDKCTGAICGVWGDPHIVTCDDLHYDCQAVGLFTVMKNHMFNVEANFVNIETPWGSASITNDLAIDFIKDSPNNVPTMQWSFPLFEKLDDSNPIYPEEHRMIGACPVLFYVDGQLQDISNVGPNGYIYGDENADHSVKLEGYNQINVQHMVGLDGAGEKYYSNSIIWVEGGGPFTEWSCILTYFLCLPQEEQLEFAQSSIGLLGTPNGKTSDDWMQPDGMTLAIPDHDRHSASFQYCVDNWCVAQEDSIMVYEDGATYEDYMCDGGSYEEFDVNDCQNPQDILDACADSPQPIACQMEKCIGNPDVEDEIDIITNITKHGDDDDDEDKYFLEDPDSPPPDYGDCANLGSGLSGSTGAGAWSLKYPALDCIWGGGSGFSIGYDSSASLLVGGSFTCKEGAGFEGKGVFLGDFNIEEKGCERMAATGHGSLIHPPEDSSCIEVGGAINIASNFTNSKYVMYEYGNTQMACHMIFKDTCTLNGEACPHTLAELEDQGFYTNGDLTQNTELDLTHWSDELTLLQQKTEYWMSLDANGVTEVVDGMKLVFHAGADQNSVQIFKIAPIGDEIADIIFSKDLFGKTILILVEGEGDFKVPTFCYHKLDAMPSDQPRCGADTFPAELISSIAWVFPTEQSLEFYGNDEFQGSIVVPYGDLTVKMFGQSGRLIVGGDLIVDGEYTELHNYEFDPVSHPLPLGEDLDEICEIQPPPACVETYLTQTPDTVCPTAPEGVVTLIKSNVDIPEGQPIFYDLILEPPTDPNSAHTVKFKVDNPFTNFTDIYIKHVKKVGQYAMDPVCETMPFTAGCELEAPLIEVGCHEYDGVDPFALVNIYFASNNDFDVLASSGDVNIDRCCHPPAEYENGYGIVELTYEIKCVCPEAAATS